jgi:biofilm PGA synthesis N-glycosyltransferase PgaC
MLVLYYWVSWRSIPLFCKKEPFCDEKISVIIPARNEEKNIGALLEALSRQDIPASMMEVIVVDDDSTDNTSKIVRAFEGVKLVSLKGKDINSYKKKAIESGIAAATGELIVTTDADCIPGPGWLRTIAACRKESNPVLIAGPVMMTTNSSVLQNFQAIDFMVLQGITGAAIQKKHLSMCNGANLSYERKVFHEVNGFEGIDEIASGDDMLLMHKITNRYPGRVAFLKSPPAIVSTEPMKTWKEFFNQRIRWASKAAKYNDKRLFPVLLLVYLVNLAFLVMLVAGYWNSWFWILMLAMLLLKTIAELPLLVSVAGFFNRRPVIKYFLFFQPLHIIYTIVSGFLGQWGRYEWKGRMVR